VPANQLSANQLSANQLSANQLSVVTASSFYDNLEPRPGFGYWESH